MRLRTPSSGSPGRSTTTRAPPVGAPPARAVARPAVHRRLDRASRSARSASPTTPTWPRSARRGSVPARRVTLSRTSPSRPASAQGWSTVGGCCAAPAHWPRSATSSSTGAPGVDGAPSHARGTGIGQRRRPARAARRDWGRSERREVQARAAAGETRAVAIWQQAIAACAAGVSNLVMSFYPSTVVIGGGLGRQDDFFGPLREMVLQRPGHHPADLDDRPLHARRRCRAVRRRRMAGSDRLA